MSHQCTACRGLGRIGEGYKHSVKFRGTELETLDSIFRREIERSHSEEHVEKVKILQDRLYKPLSRRDV